MSEFRAYKGIIDSGTVVVVPQQNASNAYGQSRPNNTTAVVHALYVSNVNSTEAVDVTVDVYDGDTPVRVVMSAPLPHGSSLVFDKPINLEGSDRLRVQASEDNSVEVYASTLLNNT